MAMLKFKKGPWAKLPEASVEGTIYVTTDEQAMYVDIANGKGGRIRIGDIIRVNTFNELQPPFSNTAFYYVESSNALLKRVATGTNDNGEVIYAWKQINGTKELQDALTALTNRVSALEGVVGSDATGLVKDVNDLKTLTDTQGSAIQTNASDIEGLKAAIGMNEEGEVEGLAGSVAALRKDLTDLETEVHGADNENGNGGMQAVLADHENRIGTLETKNVALQSDVTAAKTAILGTTTEGANYNGTVKGAYEAAAAADVKAGQGIDAAAAAKAIADANTESLSALASRVTTLDQAGTGKVAVLEGKVDTLEKAGYATVNQVNAAKTAILGQSNGVDYNGTVKGAYEAAALAKSAADAADDKAANAQGDISAWKEAHKNDYTNIQIDNAVADAKKAGTDAQDDFDAYETAHAKDYTNDQIDTKIKTVQDKVDEHTAILSGLTGENGSIAEAKAAADAAQADIDDWKEAHKNDYTNAQIDGIVADAKEAGTDAQAIAKANADEIASLKGAIGAPKQGTGDGTEGNKAATGLYELIEESNAALKAELSAEIDADIRAANAMEYAGTIETSTALPTTAKNGATYVVGSAFSFGSINCAAGDMLIAQGAEDVDTGLITNPTWTHVKTGYDASLNQKLTGDNNKIKLSDGIGDDDAAGIITFEATGSASVSVANNTVTISMVWEDFGE